MKEKKNHKILCIIYYYLSKRVGFFSKGVKNLVTVAASGDRNWVSKVEEKDFSFFENHVYIRFVKTLYTID